MPGSGRAARRQPRSMSAAATHLPP